MLGKTENKSAIGSMASRIINKFIFFTFYEQIWGCMFFVFVLLASFIIKRMVDFHVSPLTRDLVYIKKSDWLIVIVSGFLNWLIRDYFSMVLQEKVKSQLDTIRYKTDEERTNRAKIVIKWILDFIYYSLCTVAAYFILSGQEFIPWQMGGSGECRNSLRLFPTVPEVPGLREYYLIQFGVHLYSFIYQILMKRSDHKFYEFLAHHGFAVMLIGFSYSMNFPLMGSIVLYTHDISDACLVLARSYSDMKFRNKHVYSFLGALAFFCWIYTRLYVFPKCVIKVGVEYLVGADYSNTWTEGYRQLTDTPFIYMQSMAMVLLCMHIYWAIFMWKALFIAITKKKVKIEYEEKEKVHN